MAKLLLVSKQAIKKIGLIWVQGKDEVLKVIATKEPKNLVNIDK